MSTQFLTDSKGDKVAVVVIPINEYEDLMEDVADLPALLNAETTNAFLSQISRVAS